MAKLITKEVENRLKKYPLYSQDGVADKKILVKFFGGSSFSWVVVEAEQNGDDWEFFGWVDLGYGGEWGYFRFSDIKDLKFKPFNLGLEREINEHYENGYTINIEGEIKFNKK